MVATQRGCSLVPNPRDRRHDKDGEEETWALAPGNTTLLTFPSSWANWKREGVSQSGLLAPMFVSIEVREEQSQSSH